MAVVLMSCLHNAVCKHPAPAARALHFIVYSLTRSLQHTRTWRGMEISRGSWIHLVCMTILGTCHHHTNPRAHAHQPSHVYIYIRIHIHIRACGHRVSRAWCRRGYMVLTLMYVTEYDIEYAVLIHTHGQQNSHVQGQAASNLCAPNRTKPLPFPS